MPPKGSESRWRGRSRVPVDFRMTVAAPKPKPEQTSWWVGLSDEAFTRAAKQAHQRMTQTTADSFDRSRR